MFLESTHGWYSSFMFQLLDKLAKYGGAENIAFDWWKPQEEKNDMDQTEEENDEDKSRIQQILLTLCCKVLDNYFLLYYSRLVLSDSALPG